jgi:uncharacterized membrane protein
MDQNEVAKQQNNRSKERDAYYRCFIVCATLFFGFLLNGSVCLSETITWTCQVYEFFFVFFGLQLALTIALALLSFCMYVATLVYDYFTRRNY